MNSATSRSPRSVRSRRPSMNTGATGSSNVPGRLMPMSACLLSPGPLTTQPMTATRSSSTPGWVACHSGIRSLRYCWMSRAISWKNVDVVRPQPGQAETWGRNERSPSDWRTCWATSTSNARSPPGSGVRETRIVSPMPSLMRIDSPAVDATMPFIPIPASVRPEMERVVRAGREQPIRVDEVADAD